MKFLRISNSGEIDVNALRLMGATTKRGDSSKIGFFGTGNKYALAWFLKNGIPVHIFSGETEIDIGVSECAFRDSTVSVVTVNGNETSITTDMGPSWEAWEAVREVYCNAVDEGDAKTKLVDDVCGKAGHTHYFIGVTDDIAPVIEHSDAYFANKRKALFENVTGRILPFKHGLIYRKGIRCVDEPLKTCFDYDLCQVPINENRRLSNSWSAPQDMWKMVAQCGDTNIISKALQASALNGYFESDLGQFVDLPNSFCSEWREFFSGALVASPEMHQMMSDSEKRNAIFINHRLIKATQDYFGADSVLLPRSIQKTGELIYSTVEADISPIRDAIKWLNEAGVSIRYPVILVSFNNKQVMGAADADNERILVSEIALSKGQHYLISTLLEEYVHLKHGVKDETRAMQDALLDEFIKCIGLLKSERIAA